MIDPVDQMYQQIRELARQLDSAKADLLRATVMRDTKQQQVDNLIRDLLSLRDAITRELVGQTLPGGPTVTPTPTPTPAPAGDYFTEAISA